MFFASNNNPIHNMEIVQLSHISRSVLNINFKFVKTHRKYTQKSGK